MREWPAPGDRWQAMNSPTYIDRDVNNAVKEQEWGMVEERSRLHWPDGDMELYNTFRVRSLIRYFQWE